MDAAAKAWDEKKQPDDFLAYLNSFQEKSLLAKVRIFFYLII
jgi:hypothetical protein